MFEDIFVRCSVKHNNCIIHQFILQVTLHQFATSDYISILEKFYIVIIQQAFVRNINYNIN